MYTTIVSKEVFEQCLRIRKSGLTNMFHIEMVKYVAKQWGFWEFADLSRDDMVNVIIWRCMVELENGQTMSALDYATYMVDEE